MLIPLSVIHHKYNMKVSGVLHVGGHYGEECTAYRTQGYTPVYWIEADSTSIPNLKKAVERYGQHVIEALVSDVPGDVTFNVANNGQSSSILEFGTHSNEHPDVVFTGAKTLTATTIDILAEEGIIGPCNFMNLDIQGAELMALKGGEKYLEGVDYIYTEVNRKELYKGCVLLPELDRWLSQKGFTRVELEMTIHGWGDALYVRKT